MEFYKSPEKIPNLVEDVHIYCIAHCSKCFRDSFPDRLIVNCQKCSYRLEYRCLMCNEKFSSYPYVRNHVIKGLDRLSTITNCLKCHRSYFSTKCSLLKHMRNCNSPFRYDKEILVKLEQFDIKPKFMEDVKSLKPLLLCSKTENGSFDTTIIGYDMHFYDDIQTEEEFKTPFFISQPPSGDHQPNENDFEVGNKLQTPISTAHSTPNRHSKIPNSKFWLNYCTTCNKTSKYHLKKENLCNQCKTILKYKCRKCMRLYQTSASMKSHVSTFCNTERKFQCDHCNFKAHVKSSIQEHIQAKHLPRDPGANKCRNCAKNFYSKYVLKNHLRNCGLPRHLVRWHLNCRILICDYCGYKIPSKTKLALHIQAKHLPRDPNIPYLNKCNNCEKTFLQRGNLWKHSRSCGKLNGSDQSLMISCDHCNYKTYEKCSLSRHIQHKHLPRDLSANNCRKCGKNLSSKSSLQLHSRICDKSINNSLHLKHFSCDHCNFAANLKSNLAVHIQAKHLSQDSNPHKCNKCEKNFSSKGNLTQHMQAIHLNPGMYKCDKCKRSCSRKADLQRHSIICRLSKDEKLLLKRISCDYCSSKFLIKAKVREHIINKHLPRNPNSNKCSKCEKSYSTRNGLKKHLQTCGLPEELKLKFKKKSICDYCQFETFRKVTLIKHIKENHLPPLPQDPDANKCSRCGKILSVQSSLIRHLKTCGLSKKSKQKLK